MAKKRKYRWRDWRIDETGRSIKTKERRNENTRGKTKRPPRVARIAKEDLPTCEFCSKPAAGGVCILVGGQPTDRHIYACPPHLGTARERAQSEDLSPI